MSAAILFDLCCVLSSKSATPACTAFATDTLDGALDVADKYVQKYLPASDDQIQNGRGTTSTGWNSTSQCLPSDRIIVFLDNEFVEMDPCLGPI
jgi:hypothetical protein